MLGKKVNFYLEVQQLIYYSDDLCYLLQIPFLYFSIICRYVFLKKAMPFLQAKPMYSQAFSPRMLAFGVFSLINTYSHSPISDTCKIK